MIAFIRSTHFAKKGLQQLIIHDRPIYPRPEPLFNQVRGVGQVRWGLGRGAQQEYAQPSQARGITWHNMHG